MHRFHRFQPAKPVVLPERLARQPDRSLGLPQTVLRLIAASNDSGIDIRDLTQQALKGRETVAHPDKFVQNAIFRLRKRGHAIVLEDGRYRIGKEFSRSALKQKSPRLIDQVLAVLQAIGSDDITLTNLVDRVFSQRDPVDDPRRRVTMAISNLRKDGHVITVLDGRCRLGQNPVQVIEGLTTGTRTRIKSSSSQEPLSAFEAKVVRAMKEWDRLDPGSWMTSGDINAAVDAPGEYLDQACLRNIAAKGISIERKPNHDGTRAILYRLRRKG